jgi:hypothetical protein
MVSVVQRRSGTMPGWRATRKCDVIDCAAPAVFEAPGGACYCRSCARVTCEGIAWALRPLAKPDMLGVAARHVGEARRDERALDRLLCNGRFGAVSAADPWPEHDAALARDIDRGATRSWVHATQALLIALLEAT